MKVTIIKKTVKVLDNGGEIKSLFVRTDDNGIYERIKKHLLGKGGEADRVERFIKPNEYNGVTTYAFNLSCSIFTFEAVDKWDVLDANIIFDINKKGWCEAKIQVKNGKEIVNSYTASDSHVSGWANESGQAVSAPAPQLQAPASQYANIMPDAGVQKPTFTEADLQPQDDDLPF